MYLAGVGGGQRTSLGVNSGHRGLATHLTSPILYDILNNLMHETSKLKHQAWDIH